MRLTIDIPDKDIPQKQGILDISVHFIDGKVCECDYPFKQEPETDILCKIMAEMADLIEWHDCPVELDGGNDAWYREAVNSCIGIIDKYKESEVNE